jgi:hypothetical protein
MANMVTDNNEWANVTGEDSCQDGNIETNAAYDVLKHDLREVNSCPAGENGSPRFQETDTLSQLGEAIKEGEDDGIDTDSRNKKGKDIFYFGASEGLTPERSTKAKEVISTPKYVGQWDSVLNQMTWSCLKEGEHIQLVKDLKSDSYFPRVQALSTQSLDNSQP